LDLKSFKITRTSEYKELFVNADKMVSKYLVVLYKTPLRPESCQFRYGITVSKRVGNAVKRNKCKRIIRVLMKDVCTKQFARSLNINVIVRKFIIGRSFVDIKIDFTSCFNKIFANERRDVKTN
jgi:ribonuclease P protein component